MAALSTLSTRDPPPMVVHVCPACDAMQPVGRIEGEEGNWGAKSCAQCGRYVAYGPKWKHWCGKVAICFVPAVLAALVGLNALLAENVWIGGALLAAAALMLACCVCCVCDERRQPRYGRAIWTRAAEVGEEVDDAPPPHKPDVIDV